MTFNKFIAAIFTIFVLIGALFMSEAASEYSYPGELALATEYPAPGEADATRRLIKELKTVMDKSHTPPDRMRRDAHSKQHGLVRAQFTVSDGLSRDLRVGIFRRPQTYEAWIRFSTGTNEADTARVAKGMAIKVMGVEGRKVLPGHREEGSQDFVLMSTPFFVTKDIAGFAELITAMTGGKRKIIPYAITHPRTMMLIRRTGARTPDLLDLEWGSTTPYRFDDRAVKYAVRPRRISNATMPKGEGQEHFLKTRLSERLSREDVILDFYVQFQTDPNSEPIEDPRKVWKTPLVKVGEIRIPMQEFDTPEQDKYGDTLSFTPWHALPEHRPLGGMNRGRRVVYNALSKFRHDRNNEPVIEPESWRDFEVWRRRQPVG